MRVEIARGRHRGHPIGIKLVRGAYMDEERELAAKGDYPSPINDSIEDTAHCYNNCVEYFIYNKDSLSELLVASHNDVSVRRS